MLIAICMTTQCILVNRPTTAHFSAEFPPEIIPLQAAMLVACFWSIGHMLGSPVVETGSGQVLQDTEQSWHELGKVAREPQAR